MFYLVDTHTLLWFLSDSPQLGKEASKICDDKDNKLIVSVISLAEIKYLFEKKKIPLSLDMVTEVIKSDQRVTIYPVELSVVESAPPQLDVHDGIIVGTALLYRDLLGEEIKIITKDENIVRAGIIKTIW